MSSLQYPDDLRYTSDHEWVRDVGDGVVRVGITSYAQALEDGTISLAGPPRLTRSLPTWFAWSPFAPAVRERLAAGS